MNGEARKASRGEVLRYRTCCDCCHIKTGTVFLGLLEAGVAVIFLFCMAQHVLRRSQQQLKCNNSALLQGCFSDFATFNITLVLDYAIGLILLLILVSVLLMFCGIMSDTSSLLFPHLFIQGLFLLVSIGYFLVYAWSYFYGDLYTNHGHFTLLSFGERMWMASLLIVLSGFQIYLFFAVARCALYLGQLDSSRRERESAFYRTAERVRIAKENGLWREDSLGGFMEYKGQHDGKPKKQKTNTGHVKWNMDTNVVVLVDEEEDHKPLVEPEGSSTEEKKDLERKHSKKSEKIASETEQEEISKRRNSKENTYRIDKERGSVKREKKRDNSIRSERGGGSSISEPISVPLASHTDGPSREPPPFPLKSAPRVITERKVRPELRKLKSMDDPEMDFLDENKDRRKNRRRSSDAGRTNPSEGANTPPRAHHHHHHHHRNRQSSGSPDKRGEIVKKVSITASPLAV